jgi:hypothetical protein
VLAVRAAPSERGEAARAVAAQAAQTQELQSFTHFARIPAGSDPATIHFEKIRSVTVPISVQYTADAHIAATGQPLASDESPTGRSTFQVYFRPDELAPNVRTMIETGGYNSTSLAEYFRLNTYPERVRRTVIDESQFYDDNFVDGNCLPRSDCL